MIECLLLGDSIAVGIHQHAKQCKIKAEIGINSATFVRKYVKHDLSADTVVISLGTNDSPDMNTYESLNKLRKNIMSKKVYWIMPVQFTTARDHVEMIAAENDDILVRIPYVSKDGIHPSNAGYQRLGEIFNNRDIDH
jgi:lysophospholipase L1-like esterase